MTPIPLPAGFLTSPLAHRAYHNRAAGRPENSRAAILAAITAGYGIEIDLQLSADGDAMVFHDDTLERLTAEQGFVHAHTTAALSRVRLRDCDETIPTLTEILGLVAGRVPLLIEIKDQEHNGGPGIGPLEHATARALQAYGGPVAVMSFNPDAIAEMARLAPSLPRGLTTGAYDYEGYAPLPPALCDRLRDIPDYTRTGASFISHEWRDLPRPRVAELKAAGARVLCWTVKSEGDEALARQIADNITFEQYPAALPA